MVIEEIENIYFDPNKSILAFGIETFHIIQNDSINELNSFTKKYPNLFKVMCLSYDCKNDIEALDSDNTDFIQFPTIVLWVPKIVVSCDAINISVLQGNPLAEEVEFAERFFEKFRSSNKDISFPKITFTSSIEKQVYIHQVNLIKQEIQLGNCYELNYCQEFQANFDGQIDSLEVFKKLFDQTNAPFSVYLKLSEIEIFCASPERYLRKEGNLLVSEPIKGTIRRGIDSEEDGRLISELQNNKKEVAENVMIVDLVRNDLSRIATKGSVSVDELCGLHTFQTVHHLISTVSCKIKPGIEFSDIISATFPMGSMTGAPKYKVMQLIEKHENFKRGIYSGSIGLIDPNGDFDLNVVIRSLVWNKKLGRMSCGVGSAITIHSDPEKEYEECLVKVNKIIGLFND